MMPATASPPLLSLSLQLDKPRSSSATTAGLQLLDRLLLEAGILVVVFLGDANESSSLEGQVVQGGSLLPLHLPSLPSPGTRGPPQFSPKRDRAPRAPDPWHCLDDVKTRGGLEQEQHTSFWLEQYYL